MAIDWDEINTDVNERTSFSNTEFSPVSDEDRKILAGIKNREQADAFVASRKVINAAIAEFLLKFYPK